MAAHDTPLLGDADAGDLDELLKLHVKEAIRSKSQKGGLRRASSYNNLVEQIRRIKEKALGTKDEEQVEYLTSVLDALTTCVSSLHEREHESLLNEVFGISIWQATPDLRAALLRLVTHLVVANSALVPLCLRVLAMGLQPPPSPPTEQQSTASAADNQEWRPSPELVEIQGEVIAALEKVLTLVPTAPSRLVAVIAGGIPHRLRDCDTQCLYLRGALALAEAPAAAAVREGILAAAAEHLLSLDVEIRWQDIAAADADAEEEEEGESEQEEEDIFELEGQTEHLHIGTPRDSAQAPERLRGRGGWEGAAGGADAEASPSGRQPTTESAEKLDALMGLVFEHLGRRCEAGQLLAAWNTTLHTFQRTILHTHRSKFTQYLLWYLCEKDPKHCSASLVQLLLGQLTSPNTAPITRSAAAAYVASFLARAAMVPEDILIGALQKLALWCLAYCQEQDARDARAALAVTPLTTRLDMDAGPPRGIQHQVFYAACQGLLYVLCYRLEQLMEAPAPAAAGTSPANTDAGAGAQIIRQLFTDVMPKLLHHRLAPLAVCLPTVVAEFTRLAQRLNLMDCTALLPGRLEAARAQRPLEMFFPFDPFLLRHSAQHLDLGRTYVHWKAGHPSQAAVNAADADASDMSSDEEVEGVSETDDEDNDKASSSDEESESSSDSDSSDELEDDSVSAERRREPLAPAASNAPLWPHAPIGMRPISAGASRKRPASSTPGSDQGYLHGASFDTNGGMSPLEGSSPGAHPSISPMSWVQSFEGNRLMNRHMQLAVVHTAE